MIIQPGVLPSTESESNQAELCSTEVAFNNVIIATSKSGVPNGLSREEFEAYIGHKLGYLGPFDDLGMQLIEEQLFEQGFDLLDFGNDEEDALANLYMGFHFWGELESLDDTHTSRPSLLQVEYPTDNGFPVSCAGYWNPYNISTKQWENIRESFVADPAGMIKITENPLRLIYSGGAGNINVSVDSIKVSGSELHYYEIELVVFGVNNFTSILRIPAPYFLDKDFINNDGTMKKPEDIPPVRFIFDEIKSHLEN